MDEKTIEALASGELEPTDNERLEAAVLARIAELMDFSRKHPTRVDARWVSIARTQIELGFMAINRAIAAPKQ